MYQTAASKIDTNGQKVFSEELQHFHPQTTDRTQQIYNHEICGSKWNTNGRKTDLDRFPEL